MAKRPLLIGLWSSSPGQGKSTAAYRLQSAIAQVRRQDCQIIPFAQPLKLASAAFLEALGLNDTEATRAVFDTKDAVVPGYNFSGRDLLCWLGGDVGRDKIDVDLWVNVGLRKARLAASKGCSVIHDDVRMPNEAAAIKAAGGLMVRVVREKVDVHSNRAASVEGLLADIQFDAILHNCGTLEHLDRLCRNLVRAQP